MIQFRLGVGWKQDPELRAALARGLGAALVVDAVAIEVDGVDIGAGRAEGELLVAVEELVRAAARLVGGAHRAAVHFPDGGLELLLRRRGGSALLTLVSLERPSRVLADSVEVELPALARAAREAGEALLGELAVLGTSARGWGSGVDDALSVLAAARPVTSGRSVAVPPTPRPPTRREHAAASCGFELHDDEGLLATYSGGGADLGSLLAPGRVWIRAAGGREVVSIPGAPFLVLRDLTALAERISAAWRAREPRVEAPIAIAGRRRALQLEVDLAGGTVTAGGDPVPCQPLALSRALLEAALDFCGAACARNRRQERNAWVADLRASAEDRLAHLRELAAGDRPGASSDRVRPRRRPSSLPRVPLAPGRMKRLAFRRAWEAEVGAPAGFGVARVGELVLAAGSAAVVALDATTGRTRWQAEGARWAARAGDGVLAVRGGALTCHDLATGRTRWSRPLAGPAPRGVAVVGGGPIALSTGAAVLALDAATGRTAWRHEPPAASALQLAHFGPLALAATDAGFLYALDAGGAVRWRIHLPGGPAGPPQPLGGEGLALCATPLGGALLRFDAATGRRRHEAHLHFTPAASVVPFAGLLAVTGSVGGDPVVAAVDASGRIAWTDAAPIPGSLAAGALAFGLLVKNAGGACAALDRAGATVWTQAREAPHPPPANLSPVFARGLVLVSSEQVVALDPATGTPLGAAQLGAPVRLVVDHDLSLVAMDAAGVVTAARLASHLSVV